MHRVSIPASEIPSIDSVPNGVANQMEEPLPRTGLITLMNSSDTASEARNASTTSASDSIDSALLAALRDPRERVPLLRLELALVDFMQSDASWLEVGGSFNSVVLSPDRPNAAAGAAGYPTSFQRCVLHRLADRFDIIRENGSLLAGGSIRLVKIPESKVPTQLLQDLDPIHYAQQPSNEISPSGQGGPPLSATSITAPATIQETTTKLGKMKIIKRGSGTQSLGSGASTSNPHRSGSSRGRRGPRRLSSTAAGDREKAYAEARARIFNDEESQQSTSASTDDLTALSPSALSGHRPNSEGAQPLATDFNGDSGEGSAFNGGTALNSQGNEKTKAVYRNWVEEAADPDFRRGTMPVPYPPVMGMPNAPSGTQWAGYVQPMVPVTAQIPPIAQPFLYYAHASSSSLSETGGHGYQRSDSRGSSRSLTADAPEFYPRKQSWSSVASQSSGTGNSDAYHLSNRESIRANPSSNQGSNGPASGGHNARF